MEHYFPHEQLDVYGVALRFAGLAEELLATWSSSWAVHGQFDRAVESIVTSMAKAARLRATDAGIYSIDMNSVNGVDTGSLIFRPNLEIETAKNMKMKRYMAKMPIMS